MLKIKAMANVLSPAYKLFFTLLVSSVASVVAPALVNLNAVCAASAASTLVALPDFSGLVDKVGPAVVNIRTTVRSPEEDDDAGDAQIKELFQRYFGVPAPELKPEQKQKKHAPQQPGEQVARGIGSGFIISRDGYVLTNAHVVDGADEVYVKLTDGREFAAKLIGSDQRTDVAVLKIAGTGLPEVTIGDSSRAKVGEWVIAIGSPFELENTVTSGIISAKGRETGDFLPLIQTDVAVNPGSSGGPLINMRGEVVGINSQIYSKSGGFMGISFAVPINDAIATAEQLQASGHVTRGRLGVYLGDVSKDIAQAVGLPSADGSLVGRIEKDSPAELAGIQGGDIITRFNDSAVKKSADLRRNVAATIPGKQVDLVVWRKGAYQTISVVLAAMEIEKKTADASPAPATLGNILGIAASNLTETQKKQLRLTSGVVLTEVDGVAAHAGLLPGDILLTLNNKEVIDLDKFTALSAQITSSAQVLVLVRRGENAQFFSLHPNVAAK